jgi:DNA/RNA-binding domain of Phe-tRNA-synthetase-like protein
MRYGCRIQLFVDDAEHSKTSLAVVSAPVLFRNRRVDFHILKSHQPDSMPAKVRRVLLGIELNDHDYIVDTIKFISLCRTPTRSAIEVAGE